MKFILKSMSSYVALWLAAVAMAFALAVASPNEASVMGHLPDFMLQTLTHEPTAVPGGLPSDRTLALITFQRDQRAQADSWITGLNLNNDASISWMRMPVLNDPGTSGGRSAVENRLLQNYPGEGERAKLVPVFTDRADFVRAVGLGGVHSSYAVVVNRRGDVLARVEGEFDPAKAQLLRETLQTREF
jgi:hypothetical protein